MKLWGGRFSKSTDKLVEEFTASISFDQLLVYEDIAGSIAHAKMLGTCQIITKEEEEQLIQGLTELAKEHEEKGLEFTVEDEDIHMNVERLLTEKLGPVAGKLHTARSRNDQVALDVHLYVRRQICEHIQALLDLQKALAKQAEENLDTIFPGYTHLQRAQPVLFAHHMLAYAAKFQRDIERLQDAWKRANLCPLGAGAMAGTSFPIDREYVAELLNFDGVYENSMDAVSDRDYIVEFISICASIITHLSRLSEELVLWCSSEFSFVELDDAFCTGSSIMPQKKNPDVAELVRGKTGRVYGALIGLLTVLKGLPLTYNKDLQDDKEGLFDTAATVRTALTIFAPMIETMQVNQVKMRAATRGGFANATDLADYLAKKGLPFRDAHRVVGELVAICLEKKCELEELPLDDLKKSSDLIEEDIFEVLKIEAVVNARQSRGGTGKEQVQQQLSGLEAVLKSSEEWLKLKTDSIAITL